MKILKQLADALSPSQKEKQPDPETMDHVLHRLWSERVGSPGYDKDEKRLWMALQRFVERKGGLRAPFKDYDA